MKLEPMSHDEVAQLDPELLQLLGVFRTALRAASGMAPRRFKCPKCGNTEQAQHGESIALTSEGVFVGSTASILNAAQLAGGTSPFPGETVVICCECFVPLIASPESEPRELTWSEWNALPKGVRKQLHKVQELLRSHKKQKGS